MDVKSVLTRSETRDYRMDLHSVGNFMNVTVPLTLLPSVG
jgi:hypothetical protein